jgi:hypothetical protein
MLFSLLRRGSSSPASTGLSSWRLPPRQRRTWRRCESNPYRTTYRIRSCRIVPDHILQIMSKSVVSERIVTDRRARFRSCTRRNISLYFLLRSLRLVSRQCGGNSNRIRRFMIKLSHTIYAPCWIIILVCSRRPLLV